MIRVRRPITRRGGSSSESGPGPTSSGTSRIAVASSCNDLHPCGDAPRRCHPTARRCARSSNGRESDPNATIDRRQLDGTAIGDGMVCAKHSGRRRREYPNVGATRRRGDRDTAHRIPEHNARRGLDPQARRGQKICFGICGCSGRYRWRRWGASAAEMPCASRSPLTARDRVDPVSCARRPS